ncbi:MAG TPA: response regulator [Desulfobacteraceae bacterium]|nr:response regulator [Desulfobacteraceae bacterium]|tara:strand:- start:91 stop:567 length:477 start_codon:yes stop_codon:yes gene_type:complete
MTLTDKRKVLIIEDEMEMRFYLMTVVTSLGFDPVMTRNGAQGLEMLKTRIPDLIILDIMMPEKGGALVYRELVANERYRKIPLMIFSGVDRSAFEHYVKMLNTEPPADTQVAKYPVPKYYVEKSADPDYLKKRITTCMNDPAFQIQISRGTANENTSG